ncbi:MAG: DUF47 family protein [Leptospirales bacterium]|nr:DUF47 family protein [Leptospirales bacterium]
MKLNTIFSFLIPREAKFFPLISGIGLAMKRASELLLEFIKSDKRNMDELYVKIKSCEREADALVGTIFEELHDTFITPFDREDIQALCERLDDVVDSINSCAKRILISQPKHIPIAAVKMCEIILTSCNIINSIAAEIKTMNKNANTMLGYCDRLHALEHEGDDLYEEYVKQLFETEPDSIELFKLKEIVQELEKTTDRAHSVGKIIKTMIVKYA